MYTSYTMSYNLDITLTCFCEPTTANAYMVYILKHNLNNVLLALHWQIFKELIQTPANRDDELVSTYFELNVVFALAMP